MKFVLSRPLKWCFLSKVTVMEVLSVLSRQLWCCFLVSGDSYGGVICFKATVIMVLSVLTRQLWWFFLV